MRSLYWIVCFFMLLLLNPIKAEAKRIKVYSIESFLLNNESKNIFIIDSPIDLRGHTVEFASRIKLVFISEGAIYNGGVIVKDSSEIRGGQFVVEEGYSINDIVEIRGVNCRIINTSINGTTSQSRFGISAFDSQKTIIKKCVISNIGEGVDNTAGIRLQGDCSSSIIQKTKIEHINATNNSSGLLIQKSEKGDSYSTNITISDCSFSQITPATDGDGIKILQNHKSACHIIRRCFFRDCAKRAIKVQGLGVQCIDNYVSGGCNEAIIDYQNGDCYIKGLIAENLGYVYAGIYIQGSEGPVVINRVNINANNTEKKYVRGIKIKRAPWDDNNQIKLIRISNCSISNFYQSFVLEGFDEVYELSLKKCYFGSVTQPLYIDSSVSKFSVYRMCDKIIEGNRTSIVFKRINECKESYVDIKIIE